MVSKDPKIGLVLEGDAALGLAHIGVLQWLEEHRIPINYGAGTSMGGFFFGMYATGNSPTEIRTLVDGVDWPVVLRGEVPYGDLSFRRKEDAEDFPNGLTFGIKGGIRFPECFNSGRQAGLILDRPTPNEALSVQATKFFFRKRQMDLRVEPSTVPYRDWQ